MKLAYSANAYRKFPITEAIDRIADLGYTGIELMLDRPHAWPPDVTPKLIDAIRGQLDKRGLTITNLNAFMMEAIESFIHPSWIEPDASYRSERIEHTKRSLRLAKQLGAPCITTEPGGPVEGDMTRRWALDTFVEELKPVLELAEREEVMLLVEPEPDLLIENSEQFLELASRIDSPFFGHNYDIGHFYCVSEDLPVAVEKLKHLTRHYHVEDIAESRVHHHLIPGHGAIDFAEVLRAVRVSGYDGWVTVELYPNLDDPDAAGREALEHLRKIIDTL